MKITTKVSEYGYDLEINFKYFFKSVTLLIIQTPLSCIDEVFILSTIIAYNVLIKIKVSDS